MGDFLDNTQRHPPLRAEIQTALNLIPAFAWCCNPSGGLSFLNERGADYLGLPKDHPIRHGIDTGAEWDSHIALLHPDDHEEARRVWSNLLRTGCAGDVSFRVRNAEGRYRWHLSRAEPVRASDGTLLYWIGVNLDIEDRKQTEFYLAEGQRLARTGSWAFNAVGFDYWSPELFRIYGLDPSGKAPTLEEYIDLVHPDDREFVAETIQKMFAEHRGFDFTKRIVRPDGEIRRIRCVGSPATHAGAVEEFFGTGMDVTEHEFLTQELGRREAYLAEAQSISHTGSFGWRPDSGEIIWSAETYRIFEYDRAVTPTIDLLVQRVHPEDRADVQSVIERASEGAPDVEHAYRLLLPDGRVKHVRALAHATQDASGRREFVGAVTDITEQRQAEESLRESESYLAEAQTLSHTGSWAWNPNFNNDIRYWSEECYLVLGFDPVEPVPRFEEFFQKIHPDDQAASRERFEKAIRDKADFEMDYRIVHPDKGVRDIHVVGSAVLDRSSDLGEFVGTVIDVTERKRAEQELQQLVDFVPQLIVVFDSDGKVIHANRVAREYTGLTLEEFRSLDVIGRIFHPDDVERVRAARRHGFAGSEPFELDARWLGKDGIHRWFLWRYNPFVEEGRVRRWYVTATEIESRKQEEERIRQENVRLEERTRIAQELHDTLLQTFQSASLHLGAAVLRVAQDSPVKNQLDRILEIMRQGIVEGRSAIQGLRSSGSQTSDLVGALSRIQDELKVQPDIDFRVTVTGRQKQLAREIQHEIYRIGREALFNAFCHSGAKRIELELEYSDSELYVRIRDNGCGIDPQTLEKGRDGHWGLAGMRERATRIGGLLKVLSSPAAGTEVQLSIPTSLASELSLPHHSSG